MITARRPRPVHFVVQGRLACNAPRGGLIAVDSDNNDRVAWVTCAACRRLLAKRCEVRTVTSI